MPGDSTTASLDVNDATIEAFADLSGDENLLHLDEEYAAETMFGMSAVVCSRYRG